MVLRFEPLLKPVPTGQKKGEAMKSEVARLLLLRQAIPEFLNQHLVVEART